MDFNLGEEEKMLQKAIRDFAGKEIAPIVDEYEEKEEFPVEVARKLGKLGYLWPSAPIEYGGAGMSKICDAIVREETARVCAGIAQCLGPDIAPDIIRRHGNEEQKRKYLVPTITGEKIGAYGLTEPDAGSDAASIKTTAVRRDEYYIVNGDKCFITRGNICDYVTLMAMTDKSKGYRGMSCMIVDRGTPNFSSTKLHKMGIHSSDTAMLAFQDSPVPVGNLVGEEGRGFNYTLEALDYNRLDYAAMTVGLAQAAYEAALDYAKTREQFGQPIGKQERISFAIADMATMIKAARWQVYYACWLSDHVESNMEFSEDAAMAKLFAGKVCMWVTQEALQIYGGHGLMMDSPVQRYARDARFYGLMAGSLEMCQLVIGRRIGL